jgi:hypothetical protein
MLLAEPDDNEIPLCALVSSFLARSQPLCSDVSVCVYYIHFYICARKYCYMCASTAGSAAFDPHQQSFPLEINIAGGVIETRERK